MVFSGEELLDQLEQHQITVTPYHVHVCLRLQVERIDISGSVVDSGVLETANARTIRELSLYYGGCGNKASKIYNFLSTAHNLTHLQCRDFCNDKMLEVVAQSCPNLRCLELHACDVTNDGVLRLCGLNQDVRGCIEALVQGQVIQPTSMCARSLKQIKLTMTKITEAGVAIILLVLSGIELLRVPDIKMNQLFNFIKELQYANIQSNLLEFHSRDEMDEFQLSVLTKLCPNLEYIQVSFSGIPNIDASRLACLTTLKNLKRAKFADLNNEALVWFIRQVGRQISGLHLYTYHKKFADERLFMSRRDFQDLAEFCPKLSSLIIDGYVLNDTEMPMNGNLQYFTGLESLQLTSMCLSEDDLRVFLTYCKHMRDIDLTLRNPHVIHDGLIGQMLDSGCWKDLVKIKILHSPITHNAICRMVAECPLLQELGCCYTWLISKQQICELKEKVMMENINLDIF